MEILTEHHCIVSMTLSDEKRDKLYMNEGVESHGWMSRLLLRVRQGKKVKVFGQKPGMAVRVPGG